MIRWSRVRSRDDIAKLVSEHEESIKKARETLAMEATSDEWKHNHTDSLLGSVHLITKLEAELNVLKTLVQYLSHETKPTGEQVWDELVKDFALRPLDDTWSGRGNELKRIAHDARVELLNDLRYELKSLDKEN